MRDTEGFGRVVFHYIPGTCVFVCGIILGSQTRLLLRPLTYIGKYSLQLFLTHYLFIVLFYKGFIYLSLSADNPLISVLYILTPIIATVISIPIYKSQFIKYIYEIPKPLLKATTFKILPFNKSRKAYSNLHNNY
jgi:peptidoglycan/LPS O-acetylase OafA/YrhL